MTLAPPEDPPTRNVLAFARKRPPGWPPPDRVWSRWARHIIFCVDDAFPAGTVRRLKAASPQDCFAIIDEALDACEWSRYLRVASIWEDLESELRLSNGEDYQVITFHVAPTHAHVLIREAEEFSLDATVARWKERALRGGAVKTGVDLRVWAPGFYDTVLGTPREIEAARMAIDVHRAHASRVEDGR